MSMGEVIQGEGSPEGVVEALPGQRYFDYTSNTLWIKEEGDGASGWKTYEQDSGGGGAAGVGDTVMVRGYADGGTESSMVLTAIQQSEPYSFTRGDSLAWEPDNVDLGGSPDGAIKVLTEGLYTGFIRIQLRIAPDFTGGGLSDAFHEIWKHPTLDYSPEEEMLMDGPETYYFSDVRPASGGNEQEVAYNATIPPAIIPVDSLFMPEVNIPGMIYAAYVKVVRLG